MNRTKISLVVINLFMVYSLYAQQNVPSVIVTDLDGRKKDIQELLDSTKTTILVFWNIWSHISQMEIDNLAELKDEILTKYKTEIVLINMDDSRNVSKVKPMVSAKSWSFRCYLDLNADLKRALNVLYSPSSMIISPTRKVLWTKLGYLEGDEETIISKIKELK